MPIVRISERGQLVIPQEVREKLDLQKGRRLFLDFSERDAAITLRPLPNQPAGSLRGFLKGSNVLKLRAEERRKELERDERRSHQ